MSIMQNFQPESPKKPERKINLLNAATLKPYAVRRRTTLVSSILITVGPNIYAEKPLENPEYHLKLHCCLVDE